MPRPRTRNLRLAAIHSFFRYAALEAPQHAGLIQRVLAIPRKRYSRGLVDFLTRPEIEALLRVVNRHTWIERRDHAFLLTAPDDRVVTKEATNEDKRRARQNVIFEMGYFYGKLDRLRGRVIALVNGELELPSDIAGVVYIPIDKGLKSAAEDIRREIRRVRPDLITS